MNFIKRRKELILELRKKSNAYFVYDKKNNVNMFSYNAFDSHGRSGHFHANQGIINNTNL